MFAEVSTNATKSIVPVMGERLLPQVDLSLVTEQATSAFEQLKSLLLTSFGASSIYAVRK